MNRSDAYRFGDWLVEPRLNRVSRSGCERQLEPLAMDVLAHLLAHPAEVVSTDTLLEACWRDRGDPSMVKKRLAQIRRALEDDASRPIFIETIPKRGYRTLAPVAAVAADDAADPATDGVKTVAVLPFRRAAADEELELLGDSVAEDVLNALASSRNLIVRPRLSSFPFGDTRDYESIRAKLAVSHVVEGSVRRVPGKIRILAQIVDLRTEQTVWSRRYECLREAVYDIIDGVAGDLLAGLEATQGSGSLARSQFASHEAYDAFIRARQHFHRFEFDLAEEWLAKASALDAGAVAVWVLRATVNANQSMAELRPNGGKQLSRRREYLKQALALDPTHADALAIRARYDTMALGRDYQRALDELAWLIRWNPDNEMLLVHFAAVCATIGRGDLASFAIDRLWHLAPHSRIGCIARVMRAMLFGTVEDLTEAMESYMAFPLATYSAQLALARQDPELLRRAAAHPTWQGGPELVFSALAAYLQKDFERARQLVLPVRQASGYQSFLQKWRIALIEQDLASALKYYRTAIVHGEIFAIELNRGLLGYRLTFPEFYAHPGYYRMLSDFGLDPDATARIRIPELPF